MVQIYTFGLLAALFFGSGYQVATWQADSLLLEQRIAMEQQSLAWGQEAAVLIEEAQQENQNITVKWRTKYEKVYVSQSDDKPCLDADGVWDWNDANDSVTRQAFIFDDLPTEVTTP